MQRKSLISAQIYIGKKFQKLTMPRKTNCYIESHRLFMSQYIYKKRTYYGINITFPKAKSWPLSLIPIGPGIPPIFAHESYAYVSHVIEELDAMGDMLLKINSLKKCMFLDMMTISSYVFHSYSAYATVSSESLLLLTARDRYIRTQTELTQSQNKTEYIAQSNRLSEINDFFFQHFEGEYILETIDNFFFDFNKKQPLLSVEEYFNSIDKRYLARVFYIDNNEKKLYKLLKRDSSKFTKLIKVIDQLTGLEKIVLALSLDQMNPTDSFILSMYSMINKKTSTFYWSAHYGVRLRWMMQIFHDINFKKTADEREAYYQTTQNQFNSVNFTMTAERNFLDLYSSDSDQSFIEAIVSRGESKNVEFKSTIKYSLRAAKDDKDLYYESIKSICALANTEGGTLLIGYDEDNKEYVGIEKDGFKNEDKWENFLRNHLDNSAGKYVGTIIGVEYKIIHNKTVAVVTVEKSPQRIMCKDLKLNSKDSKKLFIRSGAYTKALGIEEAIKYDAQRFG